MGDRYWISGVQIGVLMAYTEEGDAKKVLEILKAIEEEQFTHREEEGNVK